MIVRIIILLLGNILFNASGNVLMKHGAEVMGDLDIKNFSNIWNHVFLNPSLVSGVFCYGVSLIFYVFVLQKIDLSIAYPIVVAFSAILVNIASRIFFHEAIGWSQVLGYIVVILGIYLIVRK